MTKLTAQQLRLWLYLIVLSNPQIDADRNRVINHTPQTNMTYVECITHVMQDIFLFRNIFKRFFFLHRRKMACPQKRIVFEKDSLGAQGFAGVDSSKKNARCNVATDLCLSWSKVLNLVTVRGLMKTPV